MSGMLPRRLAERSEYGTPTKKVVNLDVYVYDEEEEQKYAEEAKEYKAEEAEAHT